MIPTRTEIDIQTKDKDLADVIQRAIREVVRVEGTVSEAVLPGIVAGGDEYHALVMHPETCRILYAGTYAHRLPPIPNLAGTIGNPNDDTEIMLITTVQLPEELVFGWNVWEGVITSSHTPYDLE